MLRRIIEAIEAKEAAMSDMQVHIIGGLIFGAIVVALEMWAVYVYTNL